jgi:hypothetical protein
LIREANAQGLVFAHFYRPLTLREKVKRVLVIGDGAPESAYMAAAYLRRMAGPGVQVFCPRPLGSVDAGIVDILGEDGVSASEMEAAFLDIHMGQPFDVVITLSEEAREQLPAIRFSHRIHCPFQLPATSHTGRDRLYRLRNEVKYFSTQVVRDLLAALR